MKKKMRHFGRHHCYTIISALDILTHKVCNPASLYEEYLHEGSLSSEDEFFFWLEDLRFKYGKETAVDTAVSILSSTSAKAGLTATKISRVDVS